ncbi:MAG: aminopeptidase N [Alphaproteobacteria bacterium]|nr:aminopeptidase N [Alphaproteobacteria bacterium]MBP7757666.1 aminopeptidase N [Alphaproteobacteria bacterium]MBP7761134.1 aminopeptidase N [Alphaproteobacteria bacterium]MBP7904781.1 aminopeptidase N [Alphaproteobacteria bacterium]
MRTDTPKTIHLKDYTPYPCKVLSLDLSFDIRDSQTRVTAKTRYKKTEGKIKEIFLNGEDLNLEKLLVDGEEYKNWKQEENGLRLTWPEGKDEFNLETHTVIYPDLNTRLEGLYKSGDTYCTQCEAEGFRRITFFPDRPDILTIFTVRIEADQKSCPVLLSNGNKTSEGKLENGRHFTIWHDPFPKPCYLFALVAGDLTHIHDIFTTKSGRKVDLYIYVRPGDEAQCDHAMESLKKSMKWDEDAYGLEYDLDLFNIVAVSDFNMGAMENKSLNIFNTALVLAHPDTATDTDFMRVESVIAHEYFHNWSGNRVTCRDWFQLSLKEGLTVFRDQEFSSDLHSRDVQRIDDVTHLRRFQFPEDAGPLAHPVRPDNYIEINNFYTMTVYEKGAEVIRMMRTIIGPENYRKGTDLYFSRFDGQAVTCDDFAACMEEASGMDLTQFKLWYSQAGTPSITFKGLYDSVTKNYTITLTQHTPDTPGQKEKQPMHIPVALGLIGPDGQEITLGEGKKTIILHLKKKSDSFTMENIPQHPVPSIMRGFSAPVNLKDDLTSEDHAFVMIHDTDGFNRWEAVQDFTLHVLDKMMDEGAEVPVNYINSFGLLLKKAQEEDSDKALFARMIHIPEVPQIGLLRKEIDTDAIDHAREDLINALLSHHAATLRELYESNKDQGPVSTSSEAMGRRALKNTTLHLITNKQMKEDVDLCKKAYDESVCMTDRISALHRLAAFRTSICCEAIEDFYNRFKSYPLVIDKWFAVQAMAVRSDTLDVLQKLKLHPDFNIRNPNRVRSLYAAFAMNNPVCFHAKDGSGYEFLREAVSDLNRINPQIAARLLTPLKEWKRYTPERQALMKKALTSILEIENLSPDVYEIASKSLQN